MKDNFVQEEIIKLYEKYKEFCDSQHQYDMMDSMEGFIKWVVKSF